MCSYFYKQMVECDKIVHLMCLICDSRLPFVIALLFIPESAKPLPSPYVCLMCAFKSERK